jgi:S-layer homology domain.
MKKMNLIFLLTIVFALFTFLSTAQAYEDTEAVELTPTLEHFVNVNMYSQGLFFDVHSSEWFAENVATAYELGLMNGTGGNAFGSSSNITIGESVALAARIHCIFVYGEANFQQGTPWYQCYVDYALDAKIIAQEYANYNQAATRSQFAEIFANALPSHALMEINWVEDNAIPDVKNSASYAAAIYKLYRAGILTGSDSEGTFNPSSTISRAEVAAIVTRMADKSLRKTILLTGTY